MLTEMRDEMERRGPRFRGGRWWPVEALRQEVDRLFDQAVDGGETIPGFGARGVSLRLDVDENDKEYRITAEAPGVDPKDVEVTFANGVLSIRGEKRTQRDEASATFRMSERAYGVFERRLRLAEGVDHTKVQAQFKDGILTVTAPKLEGAAGGAHRIPIATD